ncbi:MAG: Tn3 family transposase [Ktedonobacteraceae bacterium]
MTRPDVTTAPKRLHILDDGEFEALYGRPCLSGDERTNVFTLTQPEKDLLASFPHLPIQLYFLLQLGYFKAKQLFFTFTFDDVAEDVTYLLERYFPAAPRPELRMLNKRTILKQRHRILKLFGYRLCTPTDRQDLFLHAQQAARISSKPIYVLRELLHYLTEQRLVKPGYTFLQEELVGRALTAEVKRLTTMLHTLLSAEACAELDALLTSTDERSTITLLKRQPKDFSLSEMRREMVRGEYLAQLYPLARRIVPNLDISSEGITYYSSLVSYYSVFRLKQLDAWTIYLYLLCFVVHRYQRFNDHLLTCFIQLVKQYADEAKATAKETVYEYRHASNHDLPKAGEVLKLFTAEDEGNTLFGTVQEKAFALLDRQRLANVAEYLVNEASFDENAFEWEHIDSMARRFKQHLRPLFRTVDLSATRVNAPILEAIHFLKTAFDKDRSLRQIDSGDFPTDCFSAREKRYLSQRNEADEKHILPDRYEFLVYRVVRHQLEAGDLFCRDSVHFRSFEDDLVDDQQWANKEALLAQTGLTLLAQPIQDRLDALKCQLEERISAVNQRIRTGENSHLHLTTTGKRKSWTLQYPTSTEPINHPIFETVPQVSISRVLHFANHHCHFMTCFEHVLGRYNKQAADERALSACLVAWATNMGLGRMGDISDIPFATLASTSDNFLRPETLKAANACISNAIAALTMFRQYNIADMIHSSSDGQKFETALPTFNARYSPKYFGLNKGVVAYTLVANHVPVNAELIGAHDHESQFVFDLLFNNTTDIHPQVHSTDTHGTNQVNFALLHIFGYQFAPRYKAIQEKLRTSLYGFEHPTQYGEILLKPVRKLHTELIVEEWENLQRIFVSLALKTTTQSIIVHKLNSYARKNKTRQALWEYDNIISSLYLLDFVDSPLLRKNVQTALNRGESYHQLRRAVSYANFGKLRFRSEEDHYLWHECSRLITNCIVFYNMTLLSELWARTEATQDMTRIAHISPVAWQHINFYGRYDFTTAAEPINMEEIVEALAHHPILSMVDEGDA